MLECRQWGTQCSMSAATGVDFHPIRQCCVEKGCPWYLGHSHSDFILSNMGLGCGKWRMVTIYLSKGDIRLQTVSPWRSEKTVAKFLLGLFHASSWCFLLELCKNLLHRSSAGAFHKFKHTLHKHLKNSHASSYLGLSI